MVMILGSHVSSPSYAHQRWHGNCQPEFEWSQIFKKILEELKKSPVMVDDAINKVIIGMNSQIEKLKEANSNVGATNQELQKTQKPYLNPRENWYRLSTGSRSLRRL